LFSKPLDSYYTLGTYGIDYFSGGLDGRVVDWRKQIGGFE
jgi:hypothetical protein